MCVCVCVCVCVHWGISVPAKTPALSLFCQAPHKLESFQSPPPLRKLSEIKFFSEPL